MTPHGVLWFSTGEQVLDPLRACRGQSPLLLTPLVQVNGAEGLQPLLPVASLPTSKQSKEKKPPRSVQCQKPSFGGPAVTHHCGRSCLPGTAPLHLPAAAQQRNARVLGSLLRFNSEGAPSIHQGPYSPGPSNPDGFCSCASLVPTLALPCHPAHGIFPCPIP